jgi:hypothetical protein
MTLWLECFSSSLSFSPGVSNNKKSIRINSLAEPLRHSCSPKNSRISVTLLLTCSRSKNIVRAVTTPQLSLLWLFIAQPLRQKAGRFTDIKLLEELVFSVRKAIQPMLGITGR